MTILVLNWSQKPFLRMIQSSHHLQLQPVHQLLSKEFQYLNHVLLMNSIYEHLLPLATTRILEVLTEIGHCMQKNGESVDHFASWMENLFLQVEKLGYKSVKDLKLVFCQRGVLQGAYYNTVCCTFSPKNLKMPKLISNLGIVLMPYISMCHKYSPTKRYTRTVI